MNKPILGTILILGLAAPVWAQKNWAAGLERALARPQVSSPVAVLSRKANAQAYKQIKGIFRPLPFNQIQAARTHLTPQQSRQVFQVRKGLISPSAASAFALEIDGHIWGVTAGHVMNNIKKEPYMTVQNAWGKWLAAPIEKYYITPHKGSDVAIFEIPASLAGYVEPLRPALQRPAAQTQTQSPCFVGGKPLFLPSEDVLFSGPHRLLLRDQVQRAMNGYCGSPVLVNNKVVGVHVGAYSAQEVALSKWAALWGEVSTQVPPSLHEATPVQALIDLARQTAQTSPLQTGTVLKVMGLKVATLQPNEYLFSVQQNRNGIGVRTLHTHPFMNFEKLEEFFDLQNGDWLRLTVFSNKTDTNPGMIKIYEVNPATGEINTQLFAQ